MHTAILAESPICQKKEAIRKPLAHTWDIRTGERAGAIPELKALQPSHPGCVAGLDSGVERVRY
jgi:hypothetical protein